MAGVRIRGPLPFLTQAEVDRAAMAAVREAGALGQSRAKAVLLSDTDSRGFVGRKDTGQAHTALGTSAPVLVRPGLARAVTGIGAPRDKIAAEGARTVPPREHGGNCDIKDLSRGSKVYFPVYVDGAGLSVGDLHFSQGDGEITFCGAIEMAGWLHIKVDLIKDGVSKYGIKNPVFKPSPITPNYKDYLIFEGISVDEHTGEQYYLDAHVAYRRACLRAPLHIDNPNAGIAD